MAAHTRQRRAEHTKVPGTESAAATPAQRRYAALADSSLTPAAAIGNDGLVSWANAAFVALTGQTVGATRDSILHPDDAPYAVLAVAQLLEGEPAVLLESRVKQAAGGYQPMIASIVPVFFPDGGLEEFVFSLRPMREGGDADGRARYLASHDAMTGVLNRQAITSQLELITHRNQPVAVLFIDLNGFKQINDTHGHAAGDQLLIEVAQRIASTARDSDWVGRLGGDEFVVVTTQFEDAAEPVRLAERVVTACGEAVDLVDRQVFPRLSVGVAISRPGVDGPNRSGAASEQLLADADAAMYEAKRSGRPVLVADAELREDKLRRKGIDACIRSAMACGDLAFQYQPIRRMSDREVLGLEALLRWDHAELGSVTPREVIASATGLGILNEFSRWCIETACRDLLWLRDNCTEFGDKQIGLNFDSSQLEWRELPAVHFDTLARSGLRPSDIIVEITDVSALAANGKAEASVRALSCSGAPIALDGSGYNSLGHFARFEIKALKIERSLISAAPAHEMSREILGNLVDLALRLGVSLVAEGVQNDAELRCCVEAGIEIGQGFLLGTPTGLREFWEAEYPMATRLATDTPQE